VVALLHTLATYMDYDTGEAYPSQTRLAAGARVTREWTSKVLKPANTPGLERWLEIENSSGTVPSGRGRGRARSTLLYRAKIPLEVQQLLPRRCEVSSRTRKGIGELSRRQREAKTHGPVNSLHPNKSLNTSKNKSVSAERETSEQADPTTVIATCLDRMTEDHWRFIEGQTREELSALERNADTLKALPVQVRGLLIARMANDGSPRATRLSEPLGAGLEGKGGSNP